LVGSGQLSAGRVLTSFLGAIIGSTSLGMLGPTVQILSVSRAAGYRIFQVIDRPSQIDGLSTEGKKPTQCSGSIEFKRVSFAYPSRPEVKALDGVSFSVSSGKSIALVGPSGSGKSTSMALLERFYDPLQGSISLDGIDLKELNPQWLRSQVTFA